MSLKAFHILFIMVSILLAFYFAFWSLTQQHGVLSKLIAAAAIVISGALIYYLYRVIEKLRSL